MITKTHTISLLKKHNLTDQKIAHCLLVADIALNLAKKLKQKNPNLDIDLNLVEIGAILHDIDAGVPNKKQGEHGKIGADITRQEGLDEKIAQITLRHPIDAILDPKRIPQTWEEKIVAYADKRARKDKKVSLKERFEFWFAEDLPDEQLAIFRSAYPKFQELEKEIKTLIK